MPVGEVNPELLALAEVFADDQGLPLEHAIGRSVRDLRVGRGRAAVEEVRRAIEAAGGRPEGASKKR